MSCRYNSSGRLFGIGGSMTQAYGIQTSYCPARAIIGGRWFELSLYCACQITTLHEPLRSESCCLSTDCDAEIETVERDQDHRRDRRGNVRGAARAAYSVADWR